MKKAWSVVVIGFAISAGLFAGGVKERGGQSYWKSLTSVQYIYSFIQSGFFEDEESLHANDDSGKTFKNGVWYWAGLAETQESGNLHEGTVIHFRASETDENNNPFNWLSATYTGERVNVPMEPAFILYGTLNFINRKAVIEIQYIDTYDKEVDQYELVGMTKEEYSATSLRQLDENNFKWDTVLDSALLDAADYQKDGLYDVYVGGNLWYNSRTLGVYWKNGELLPLAPGNSAHSLVTGITVSGKDVCTAGWRHIDSSTHGGIWINGQWNYYSDSTITGMFIDGADVYLSGYVLTESGTRRCAAYWKNAEMIRLTDGSVDTYASDIFVYYGNVFVAGSVAVDSFHTQAVYWENGVQVTLPYGETAESIFVSNSDVYVTGSTGGAQAFRGDAVYWKNVVQTKLSGATTYEKNSGYAIFVDGGNVYVAGMYDNDPVYWKNDELVPLEGGHGGVANAVYVTGSDVFAAGCLGETAVLWKNSKKMDLPSGGLPVAGVTSIAIIKK